MDDCHGALTHTWAVSHRLSAAFPPADGTPLEKHITDAVCDLGFDLPVGLGMMRRLTCKSDGPRICRPCRKLTCGRGSNCSVICVLGMGVVACACLCLWVGGGSLSICMGLACVLGGRACVHARARERLQELLDKVKAHGKWEVLALPFASRRTSPVLLLPAVAARPSSRYCNQMIPGAGLALKEGVVFQV